MIRTTINIDTGGTFTDVFTVRGNESISAKVLTTPHDYALCFEQAIEAVADALDLSVQVLLSETVAVRYATTVGTNSVIEKSGPRLGLIVEAGGRTLYRDDPDKAEAVYDRFLDRQMVRELGRAPLGNAESNGQGAANYSEIKELLDRSARGLVCALPGSNSDPRAEREVRRQFEARYPKHCLDSVPLLLSHEVVADPDDFRRTTTTIFNAYLHPDVARYLLRAEDYLRRHGYRWPLLIVHNDGGCARVAKTVAGKTYNSGPMSGLMGARAIAQLYGIKTLVTFDMGGTSLDIAAIHAGELPLQMPGELGELEISFPLADITTLGAGGGSIAHIDGEGRFAVGPRSAGAIPGPACFGFGGDEPTVTDADVYLGYIDPDRFLGGSMKLDRHKSERALATLSGSGGAGADEVEVARRIRATVHQNMSSAIDDYLHRRKIDVAEAVVVAFGGTHVCEIAEKIGIREILLLPFASVFSAFGASAADVTHTYVKKVSAEAIEAMKRRALRDMLGEGFEAHRVRLDVDEIDYYGEPHVQVHASGELAHYEFAKRVPAEPVAPEPYENTSITWEDGAHATDIYDAAAILTTTPVSGPAIIRAAHTTYVIPAGWRYRSDEYGNGVMTRTATNGQ